MRVATGMRSAVFVAILSRNYQMILGYARSSCNFCANRHNALESPYGSGHMNRTKPTPQELGARLRAARAYRDLDQIPAAERIGRRDDTLGRYEKGRIPPSEVSNLLDRAPIAFELPEAFFVIDFSELTQMSDAWDHVKRLRRPLADLERLVEEDLGEGSQS